MKGKNQFGDFDIQKRLAQRGWSITGEYKNAHRKHAFMCPRGHVKICSWNILEKTFFCRECYNMFIQEEAIKILKGTDWHLVDMKNGECRIQCDAGHKYRWCSISYVRKKLKKNPHCSACDYIKNAASIRSVFEESGWKLLEKYKGYHNPILCRCPVGHLQKKRPSGFINGRGCQKCSGLVKKTKQEVEKEFSNLGWRVVGKYINTSTPIRCVCPKGHKVKKSLDCLKISTKGCIVCAGQVPIHPLVKRVRRNERLKNCRQWGPLVLKRDDYKCVICGSTDGLSTHHLNSYHKFIKDRYDINNGVTLCANHHGGPFTRIPGSFHMVFGCMNNTKEQFEKYRKMNEKART